MNTRGVASGWVAASVIASLAILGVVSAADARKVEYVEEVSRVFSVDPDVKLILTNTSGDIKVTTWDREEIRIIARKTARGGSSDEAKEYAHDLEVEIRREGTRLVMVDTRYPEWGGGGGFLDLLLSRSASGEIDYRVTVPREAAVVLSCTSGDVSVEGTGGSLAVSVTSGDVEVTECSGLVTVVATSGDIDVEGIRGNTGLSATTGDVTIIGVDGDLMVGVTSGDIHCQDVRGSMNLSGSSSQVTVLDSRGDLEISTSSGDIEVSGFRGAILVRTKSGDVELDIELLEDGECDVSTSSGDVEMEIPEDGSYGFVIETVSGEVDISMPEEMDVRASKNLVKAKYRGGAQLVRVSTITGDVYIESR
ncbi:MAG: DUF4097 family beta strand repeat protein [Candidatus Eisenbacteria sp.]|nr:DUF4097 family beta strand repeat protein [Candidatus Eisenbacteria bacterium]